MEVYGGKNAIKKREETREKILREKISFIKTFFLIISLIPLFACAGYECYKYFTVSTWNEKVLVRSKDVWTGADKLEQDLLNSVLFLKGCSKAGAITDTANGFQLRTVETRSFSMEVLQNVPAYAPDALSVYLGSGVKTGDTLTYCNKEEEFNLKLKTIRNNPNFGYHYLLFDHPVEASDLPSNLIIFSPIDYVWEKQADGTERLLRKFKGKESEIFTGIQSHKINYSFEEGDKAYFSIDLALNEKFPDGKQIRFQRNIPLYSFERLPEDLEGKIP